MRIVILFITLFFSISSFSQKRDVDFFHEKRLVKSKSKQNGENRYYTEVYKLLVQSWKSVYDRFWA